MAMYGIDISEHNGNINLTPYKGQFVIIRAGYGQTHEDKKFKRNVDECRRLGIPFGVYWYSYALNTAQAREEARKCLSIIAPYKSHIKVGVWFDMEDADGYKRKHGFSFSRSIISALCNEFCGVVQKAGYYVGIYASQSWMNTYISCPKYDKWVANWGSNNGKINVNTSAYGTILQYTSRPLDKDYMYADLSRYSGGSKPASTPVPTPSNKLDVDGFFGRKTTLRTQEYFGTTADGKVSNQPEVNRPYVPAAVGGVWEFKKTNYKNGSEMVRAMQRLFKCKDDGWFGAKTARAMRKFLAVKEGDKMDEVTVKAWQNYLNRH